VHPGSVSCDLLTRMISYAVGWTYLLIRRASSPAVYVVWGAAGGIGAALSKRLAAQQGATVVQVDREGTDLEGDVERADATNFEQAGRVLRAYMKWRGALCSDRDCRSSYTQHIAFLLQVNEVLKSIRDKYGCVHGVANCIGDAGAPCTIALLLSGSSVVATCYGFLLASCWLICFRGCARNHQGCAHHQPGAHYTCSTTHAVFLGT